MSLKGEYQPYPSLLRTLTYVAMLKHSVAKNYKYMSQRDKRAVLDQVRDIKRLCDGPRG